MFTHAKKHLKKGAFYCVCKEPFNYRIINDSTSKIILYVREVFLHRGYGNGYVARFDKHHDRSYL